MKVNFILKRNKSITGLGRYASTLIESIEKLGLETHVQFTDPKLPAMIAKPASWLGYDLNTFMSSYPLRVPKIDADIHHLPAENLASLLRFQQLKPVVITTHGPLTYLLRDDPEMNIPSHIFDRWFENAGVKAFHRANHIITDSEFLKRFLVEDLKLPAEHITVTYLAVDHDTFQVKPITDEFLSRHGLNNQTHRYLVYTGSEQPRKNFLTLVKAFGVIHQEFPNVRLLKIGKPEYETERAKAIQRIEELGIQDAVQFIGYVSEEDLVAFYNLAHIFVFPSRFEGFGLPPLEAMACGAPVISSAATSLEEVVGDGALIFDPTDVQQLVDAIRTLLTNEGERQALRQRGLQRAQQFTWEKTAQETIAVYHKVLGTAS